MQHKAMQFKIAEHIFTLSIPDNFNGEILNAYRPFIYGGDGESLFHVEVIEEALQYQIVKPLLEDIEMNDEKMVRVNIYQTTQGVLYNIIMPQSSEVNTQLHITGSTAQVKLNGEKSSLCIYSGFTNAMILSYINFTIPHNTLIIHASAILKDGEAHLFIGKSGTGKSTHSQMWLDSIPATELLNDDHPVIRCHENGEVRAYGSPWSGKTPCYRNLSAPLRAIVRIKRADYNKLTRLRAIHGYASVTSSCIGGQWDKELLTSKVNALESIITRVGCYQMECLPNNDAARCCYTTLCAEKL